MVVRLTALIVMKRAGVLNSAHIPLFHQTTQYRMVVMQIDSLL